MELLYNGINIEELPRKSSVKDWEGWSVAINDVPVTLKADAYKRRQKIYDNGKWIDTKPLFIGEDILKEKQLISIDNNYVRKLNIQIIPNNEETSLTNNNKLSSHTLSKSETEYLTIDINVSKNDMKLIIYKDPIKTLVLYRDSGNIKFFQPINIDTSINSDIPTDSNTPINSDHPENLTSEVSLKNLMKTFTQSFLITLLLCVCWTVYINNNNKEDDIDNSEDTQNSVNPETNCTKDTEDTQNSVNPDTKCTKDTEDFHTTYNSPTNRLNNESTQDKISNLFKYRAEKWDSKESKLCQDREKTPKVSEKWFNNYYPSFASIIDLNKYRDILNNIVDHYNTKQSIIQNEKAWDLTLQDLVNEGIRERKQEQLIGKLTNINQNLKDLKDLH